MAGVRGANDQDVEQLLLLVSSECSGLELKVGFSSHTLDAGCEVGMVKFVDIGFLLGQLKPECGIDFLCWVACLVQCVEKYRLSN